MRINFVVHEAPPSWDNKNRRRLFSFLVRVTAGTITPTRTEVNTSYVHISEHGFDRNDALRKLVNFEVQDNGQRAVTVLKPEVIEAICKHNPEFRSSWPKSVTPAEFQFNLVTSSFMGLV